MKNPFEQFNISDKKPEKPENTSENVYKKLLQAVEKVKNELPKEDFDKPRSIILYGSAARGKMTENSDVDIHLDDVGYISQESYLKIREIFEKELGEIPVSITCKPVIERNRVAKLLTAQKKGIIRSNWKFLYARSPAEESEVHSMLKRSRSNYPFRKA